MKRRDLIKQLERLGFWYLRQGGDHELWTNGFGRPVPVPRHREIPETTAEGIIKQAKDRAKLKKETEK